MGDIARHRLSAQGIAGKPLLRSRVRWIAAELGFGVPPPVRGLVPIMATGCLDSIDSREVE